MPPPDAALAHYRRQQRLTASLLTRTREQWAGMGRYLNDLDAGWRAIAPRLLVTTYAGQLAAANDGAQYVGEVLDEDGVDPTATGTANTRALAGVTSDGRPLDTLLQGAVVQTKEAIAAGASPASAVASSGSPWLDRIIATQLADAARVAAGVTMTATPTVFGYVRLLNPPSCSRCVVLAGRWYGWNAGFARHPKCDCRHVPAPRERLADVTASPAAYFSSLTPEEQDKTFTLAGAKAIRDGADVSQVVNARRGALGLSTASGQRTDALGRPLRGRLTSRKIGGQDVFTTTEGTTKRGFAGQLLGARSDGVRDTSGKRPVTRARRPRLMPETIYGIAGDDRAEALRLLRANGYLNT